MTARVSVAPGVWSWSYAGGAFPVHIALDGRFLCPQYPADSRWQPCAQLGQAAIVIDWGKFGQYSMAVSPNGVEMQGCYTGYPADWRKASFVRAHTASELMHIQAQVTQNKCVNGNCTCCNH